MVDFQAVEVGEARIPVVGVPFQNPDLLTFGRLMPERASAGIVEDITKVIGILLERLLAHDDIPAAGKRPEHEATGTGLAKLELDRVGIKDVDLAHGREQGCAGDADALGRPDDAAVRRLAILALE